MENEPSKNDSMPKSTSNDNSDSKQQKEEEERRKKEKQEHIFDKSTYFHCGSLELFVPEKDEWTEVWPLIKYGIDDGHNNNNDNKDDDSEYYAGKNSKFLYLFDNQTDRDNETIKNETIILEIGYGVYSIFEHYPAKRWYGHKCIITNYKDLKYIFKCKDEKHRRVFIDALIETIYFKKTNCLNKIYTLNNKYHFQHKYKYQPISYYMKYNKNKLNSLINDKQWFHVPISPDYWSDRSDTKFLLSVKRQQLMGFQITFGELTQITWCILKDYYNCHESSNWELQFGSLRYGVIDKEEQNTLTTYGLKFGWRETNTIPVLNGINCIDNGNEDESKDNENVNMKINCHGDICKKGFNCEIYLKVKNNYEYTESNYEHLMEKNHFNFDYNNKPKCRYGEECKSYKRVARIDEDANNFNNHRFDDLCHLCIYRHPPRMRRNDKINCNDKNKNKNKNKRINDMNDLIVTNKPNDPGYSNHYWLDDLIGEIIKNDFEKDLCLNNNDLKNEIYSLFQIVNEKLQSKYYKINLKNYGWKHLDRRRQCMLSLLLYTGCDCNYDLCKSQRNGNYEKWKVFDGCLYDAIQSLQRSEDYSNINVQLYSGLNKVQLLNNKSSIDLFYFPTYVSTSYDINISKDFANNNGMLIQFDKNIVQERKFIFCSLEWISKFPQECEILIARSKGSREDRETAATMTVIDNQVISNNNNDSNNSNNKKTAGHMQIARVSGFNHSKIDVRLVTNREIGYWNKIFKYGQKGKEIVLNMYDESDINIAKKWNCKCSLKAFKNGVNLLYNDKIFQHWCKKWNSELIMTQKDFIDMQTQSTIMKQLIKDRGFTWNCYLGLTKKWSKGTVTKEYKFRLVIYVNICLQLHNQF